MAQVYSVNVVGYVNTTLQAGQWALLNNPLSNGDNSVATVLQLPAGSSGVQVFTWNADKQSFLGPTIYLEGVGWLDSDPANPVTAIAPGSGFFVLNGTATALTMTFVGEVLQGSQTTAIKAAKWNMVGSKIPVASNLGTPSDTASLQFPAVTGDQVFPFDVAAQGYVGPYIYLDGMGWLPSDPNDTSTTGPTIPVGNGFWVLRTADAGPDWTRTFTVQ